MVKDSKSDEDKKKQKESGLKKFLIKRAPFYGAIAAMSLIFIIPALTQNDLQSILIDDATGNEKLAIDMIKSYDGPNQKGLQIIDALSDKIIEKYDKKIFDHKDTVANIFAIYDAGALDQDTYEVHFTFDTNKENSEYVWSVNIDTGKIKAINPEAKRILDLVNYYD